MTRTHMVCRRLDSGCAMRGPAVCVSNINWNKWEEYRDKRFPGVDPVCISAYSVDGAVGVIDDEPGRGVFYNEELAGPGGMSYLLFREPKHTTEDIDRARAEIRASFDAVRIIVFRITKWANKPVQLSA